MATTSPGDAAGDREQDALDERLRHDLPARRAHREPHGGLTAPRDRAREQQVRDVGAGDEQHQPAHAEQNLQAAPVLLLHDADAGAGGHDRDHLLGQRLDDVGHPVRRVAGVVLHPLVEDAGEPRAHAVGRRARTQPADHAQPRGDRLAEDRGVAVDQRLLLERNPQVRRIAAQRFAEESRRRDADDGEGVPLDEERGADDRRIAAVGALPDVVAQHDDGRRRRRVVGGGEDAAAERADAERREVVAGDVLGAQRPRRRVDVLAPHADARAAGLKRRDLLELRQSRPSAARTAGTRTSPSDPAGRPARSRCRRRRCGRGATDRRPAASAA